MTGTDNGEQPPTGAQPPVVPPLPDKPMRRDESKMSILRKVGYGLLVVAVLAALVPVVGLATDPSPPARTAAGSSSATSTTTAKPTKATTTTKKTTKKKPAKSSKPRKPSATAGEGPVIDSDSNERADSEITRSKVVVGGIAAGLLVIVIWGRRVRAVRRKKMESQAKGGK